MDLQGTLNDLNTELDKLVSTYKTTYNDYKQTGNKNSLAELKNLNEQIKKLIDEYFEKYIKNNSNDTNNDVKKGELNQLSYNVKKNGNKINELLNNNENPDNGSHPNKYPPNGFNPQKPYEIDSAEALNLAGMNESLSLQRTSAFYHMLFYLIIICITIFLLLRVSVSDESGTFESILLLVAVCIILYLLYKKFTTYYRGIILIN